MILTGHARQRIRERTKLSSTQVHSILTNELYVYLGDSEERQYHTFYSYLDDDYFVFVNTKDTKVITTVLERGHVLPVKLYRQEIKKKQTEARRRWTRYFLATELLGIKSTSHRKLKDVSVAAALEIWQGEQKEFEHSLGEVKTDVCLDPALFLETFASTLATLSVTIEGWVENTEERKPITYQIRAQNQETKQFVLMFSLQQGTVKAFLEKLSE